MSVLEFAKAHPKIRVCCAHAAWFRKDFFETLEKEKCSNLFFDIAPTNSLISGFLKKKSENIISVFKGELVDVISALVSKYSNQVLLGSDLPYLDPDFIQSSECKNGLLRYNDYEKLLFKLDDTIKYKIASENILNFIFGK